MHLKTEDVAYIHLLNLYLNKTSRAHFCHFASEIFTITMVTFDSTHYHAHWTLKWKDTRRSELLVKAHLGKIIINSNYKTSGFLSVTI